MRHLDLKIIVKFSVPGLMATNPQSMNRTVRKIPKKPGVFPPFALFSQEHRETLLSENKDIR
jgi:hypothetical protein